MVGPQKRAVVVALELVVVVHMDFQLEEQVAPLLASAHRNLFLSRRMCKSKVVVQGTLESRSATHEVAAGSTVVIQSILTYNQT